MSNGVTLVTPPYGGEPRAAGAALLDDVEVFLSRFVAYPSIDARVAHVLWIGHTHAMDVWESTPRIAFLSPEPGSGKSRALEVTELLVPRPVHAVNTTPAYLFRKVSDEAGLPTILYDEIDTVFGPRSAKDHEDVRGLLNAGHRKGAVAGRCVVKGKTVETEELPAYCAVALAGLDDMPDMLMTRSVVVRMRRRGPNEYVEPFRLRLNAPDGHQLRDRLASWANRIELDWPEMPPGVEDRDADVWEALLTVAEAAGGDWPDRARRAAVALVTASKAAPPSLGVRLLIDTESVFTSNGTDSMFSEGMLTNLIEIEESPWSDLRGKPLNARGLAARLGKYGIHPKVIRIGEQVGRGYHKEDFIDAWSRYVRPLGSPAKEPVTSVTPLRDGDR